MVPLSLTLRNFLSYGENDVTLDFTGLHVVCLSGENGHGKSALLDAITWALWGETRLGKQGHDQLIRIGADEMSVVLTFRVGPDTYRVKRQRSRRSAGANWEIQRLDGAGTWKALTGTNSGDTGRTIQQIVRMSYDTFLNSVYLKQGRADEFVRQTATRRKDILSEILELSRYDRLEEMAKQRSRASAELSADAERLAGQARATAFDGQRYKIELAEAQSELAGRQESREKLLEKRRAAETHLTEVTNLSRSKNELVSSIAAVDQDLTAVQRDKGDSDRRIASLELLLKDRSTIEADYQKLLIAQSRASEISVLLNELSETEKSILLLRPQIAAEEQTLLHQRNEICRQIENGRLAKAQAEKLAADLVLIDQELAGLQTELSRLAELKALQSDLVAEKAVLRSEHDQLDKEIQEAYARQERLRSQSETCSICGSPLPPERISDLLAESVLRTDVLVGKQKSVKASGVLTTRRLTDTAQALEALGKTQDLCNKLAGNRIGVEQQRQHAVELATPLNTLTERLELLEQALASQSFAMDQRSKVALLEAKSSELLPLRDEHVGLQETLRSLRGVENVYQQLLGAEDALQSENRTHALTERHIQSLNKQRTELIRKRDELRDIDARLVAAQLSMRKAASEESAVADQIAQTLQAIGRLQRSIEQCAEAESKAKELETSQVAYRREEDLYKTLASAFGKRGIQASIIESALPELEQYANEILDRLTDGDLRVFIETTRQAKAKSSTPIETLEIKISDSLGTRPLEMYSGGEAFRVSFALRIALSMLLVRRAGAELQTLIIDEGFGTQDAKGREKLVDAINAIKQDFEQIMVITHIEELKEAFATRIEVYKTSEGSQLRILHGDAIG